MAWVKVDDRYPRNPKVMGLSDKAFRHDVQAMCYCAEQLNDGLLPPAYLKTVPARVRAELVRSGRWDETDEGTMVHDFLDYNPSATEALSKSDAARNASRSRWRDAKGNAERNAERIPERIASGNAKRTRGTGTGLDQEGIAEVFERFWAIYPRRVGRRAALAAFAKALTRADADAICAGAQRYADDPKRSAEFTAHPTTWLNADRWTDETARPAPPADPLPEYGTPAWEAHVADEDARIAAIRAEESA